MTLGGKAEKKEGKEGKEGGGKGREGVKSARTWRESFRAGMQTEEPKSRGERRGGEKEKRRET